MTRPTHADKASPDGAHAGPPLPPRRQASSVSSPLPRPGYGRALPPQRQRRQLPPGQGARLLLLALVIVAVGGSASFVGSFLFPEKYAARAELIFLIGTEQPTGFLREDRNLTTQVLLLRSRAVVEPVAARNGLTVAQLEDKLVVGIAEGSEIINVEVQDSSRDVGTVLLRGIIDSYVSVSGDVAPAATRQYVQGQLNDVRTRLAAPGLGTGERAALTERETGLLGQIDSLNLAGSQVKIVVPPYSVADAVSPQPLLAASTGALVGLVVAGGVVLWQARRWTRG